MACFNPLPARRPGATFVCRGIHRRHVVSILSQPEGRELHFCRLLLGRCSSRFNPLPARRPGATFPPVITCLHWRCFNPLPARRPGATVRSKLPQRHSCCFNPLPARRPGATGTPRGPRCRNRVSILSQPEGRELPSAPATCAPHHPFQSSPSPKAGSYYRGDLMALLDDVFQSSPSPKAGSYHSLPRSASRQREFQSSPSPKAGSYSTHGLVQRFYEVSILSQPEGRELQKVVARNWSSTGSFNPLPARRPGATHNGLFSFFRDKVSILSQPEGRELRYHKEGRLNVDAVSILSQPEGRELHAVLREMDTMIRFQSSPSPKAGSYPPLTNKYS